MKPFVLILFILSNLLLKMASAGSMGSVSEDEPCWGPTEACIEPKRLPNYSKHRVMSFSIGPAWSNNGQTQTLSLQPDIQKRYVATFRSNVFPYGELFFGMEKQLNNALYAQIGLELAGGTAARLRGQIWEDADPDFNNYTYSYNVNEARILAKGKLLADINFYGTRPYVTGGIGIGFNNSYSFTIQPIIYQEVAAPAFKSQVLEVFTYTVGFGFEEIINENWHAAIGYEFSNWGKSQLAPASGQTVGQGLVINNIYINSVLLSVIHMF